MLQLLKPALRGLEQLLEPCALETSAWSLSMWSVMKDHHVFGELSRFEVDKQYKNSLAKNTEPPKPRYWPLEFYRQGRAL